MNYKETLTREDIRKDLLNYPATNHMPTIITLIVLDGLLIVLSSFFSVLLTSVGLLFGVFIVFRFIVEMVRLMRYVVAYRKDNFIVTKDVSVYYDQDPRQGRSDLSFCFAAFGFFRFSIYKKFYKWSKLYCLDAEGMRMYSEVGDTFYIVTADGKHPLMVYNTKLFEYKE